MVKSWLTQMEKCLKYKQFCQNYFDISIQLQGYVWNQITLCHPEGKLCECFCVSVHICIPTLFSVPIALQRFVNCLDILHSLA